MTYLDACGAVAKGNGMLAAWSPSTTTQFVPVSSSAVAKGKAPGLQVRSTGAAHVPTQADLTATDWQTVAHGSYTTPL